MAAQIALDYRTNRDLFSNHYLDDHLPDTEAWDDVSEDELREAYDRIQSLWERERDTAPQRNESQLEEKFVRPMFRELGIPFEVEESVERGQRRPDYGFFESEDAARNAFQRREAGEDFYENAVAVADAKRWGRALDTRGERERDFENPSYQIHVYLQETPAQWAVLTNGRKWRLYYGPTSHRLDSYYEVDLPTVLEEGDLEAFKYFYLFFRREAFVPDASGDSFLDDVHDESNIFAQELGEDLQDNIYEAIKVLSEGFLQYPDNDLGAAALDDADLLPDSRSNFEDARLDLVHDASLIYLYRLIFVLYAESEGRDLLDTDNEIYHESYSLNALKQEVAAERDSADQSYRDWQDNLWSRLGELFTLIDQGSASKGIPEDDLYVPAYNGGLFRTDPEEDDSREARFLARYEAGDEHLAEVIDLLTRSENATGGGKTFVDYSSLDIRHLGSIYEGLLEYELNVAGEPLALEEGEYVPADVGDDVAVETGDVYLTTDSGERKATGSYYTPEYVVEYIVENTLGPLVEDIYDDLLASDPWEEDGGGFAEEFAERVFELKVLDPAMGSGHFLTSAIDYLAREIINAQERQAEQRGVESIDQSHDINWARRQVAQRCIYGVDLNPLAVELAKVSLWLRTLAAEQPLAFLDHHLKTGNSLVGSDIEAVLDNGKSESEDGQLTLQQSFARTRQRALEHVMDRFQDLLAIDNESLADIKEMEAAFEEVRDDPLYQHLLAMANVHTAEEFGLDVPADADERMAEALRDDSWTEIKGQDWFESAQAMATEEGFFHWELEFPVAFYDEDGERKGDGGFDAVIGNPPYVRQEQFKKSKPYLESRFECYSGSADLYMYFIEEEVNLLSDGGQFGNIVSNKFTRADYGDAIRKILLQSTQLNKIIDFGDLPVFEEATAYPLILTCTRTSEPGIQQPTVACINSLGFDSLDGVVEDSGYPAPPNTLSTEGWALIPRTARQAVEKIEQAEITLDDYIDGEIYYGVKTGFNDAFFVSESNREEIVDNGGELVKPLVIGRDVKRYHIRDRDRYLVRIPSGWTRRESGYAEEEKAWKWFQAEHGEIASHLSSFEADLRDRYDQGEFWWELRSCDYYDEFEGAKIVYPIIASEPRFALDPDGNYLNDKCFMIPREDPLILAIMNSSLAQFWLATELSTLRGGYQEFRSSHLEEFPIITREAPNELESKVYDAIDYRKNRNSLNLSLLDYLGNYDEGPTLPDIGLFQPTESNILDATSEEYENLRVGDVRTERDGRRVTIHATARYKPENEEEYETDQWGYTETDYEEAFALTDLSEAGAALVEAFVPVAVAEAGGFAGFRENATKTNSLLDRLKAITLPDPEAVADDLRRYIEVKERAEELDERIEQTDRLIDEVVYDLYGLTDEEIEIVEASVADD